MSRVSDLDPSPATASRGTSYKFDFESGIRAETGVRSNRGNAPTLVIVILGRMSNLA